MVTHALGLRGESALFDVAALRISGYRTWLAGGVLGVVALLALGWFLLIRPELAQTSQLHSQTAGAQDQLGVLQRHLAEVRQQNAQLAEYRAEYETAREALPTTNEMPAFVRAVQSAATASETNLRDVVVGSPVEVTGAGATVYALPITTNAAGSAAALEAFLQRVQRVQPRAVLVTDVTMVPNGDGADLSDDVLLTLGFRAFVAPGAAAASTTD